MAVKKKEGGGKRKGAVVVGGRPRLPTFSWSTRTYATPNVVSGRRA